MVSTRSLIFATRTIAAVLALFLLSAAIGVGVNFHYADFAIMVCFCLLAIPLLFLNQRPDFAHTKILARISAFEKQVCKNMLGRYY